MLFAFGTVSVLRTLGTSLARRDLTPGVSIPRLEEIQIDGTALLFTVATTLCVGLLVGLLPVVRYALARHLDALKDRPEQHRERPRRAHRVADAPHYSSRRRRWRRWR